MATETSKRNLVRQEVLIKDKAGNVIGKKAIFHQKPTHAPQFGNYKESWRWANTTPKPGSKRQVKLAEERKLAEQKAKERILVMSAE